MIEESQKVKGIDLTAEMFLMFSRREDVFSYGDLGLKKCDTKIYGFKNVDKTNFYHIEKGGDQIEYMPVVYTWASLDNRPASPELEQPKARRAWLRRELE